VVQAQRVPQHDVLVSLIPLFLLLHAVRLSPPVLWSAYSPDAHLSALLYGVTHTCFFV
jgi:hypothetical protein